MSDCDLVSRSGDDSTLPDDERALLERARALIPRLAERAAEATAARRLPPRDDRRVSRCRHPAHPAAAPLRRHAGAVQPVLPHRRGAELGLRLVGLGLRGAGRAPMDHRAISGAGADRCVGRRPAGGRLVVAGAARQAAVPVRRGGWRLSGRYPFSSGCDYAQWAIIGAFLGEMGDPRHIAYLLVPLAEIEIVDDWHVLGLPAPAASRWSCTTCSCRSTAS